MAFKKAERKQKKLRMALGGPTGSGKTFTALKMARALGSRIAVIDTEHGASELYAGDVADFEIDKLVRFSPHDYIAALKGAAEFDVTIIDSLSHAWMGTGGIIDQKDRMGGKFQDWAKLTPQQNELVEAILAHPTHIISTMRTKTEYEISKDEKGRTNVERVGTKMVQRDDVEYEFDVVGMMDQSNTLHVIKSRCIHFQGHYRKPGEAEAKILLEWLSSGAPPAPEPAAPPAPPTPKPQTMEDRIAAGRAKLAAITTREQYDAFTKLMKSSAMPDEIRLALSAEWVAKGKELSGADAAQ